MSIDLTQWANRPISDLSREELEDAFRFVRQLLQQARDEKGRTLSDVLKSGAVVPGDTVDGAKQKLFDLPPDTIIQVDAWSLYQILQSITDRINRR